MIGWYVHHHGTGHLSRMLAVTQAVRHRRDVTVLSSLPRPDGCDLPWVDLPMDTSDAPPADPTARGALHWVPEHVAGLADRGAAVASWVARERPSVVVVDVSVEVTLLVRLLGVPVVVVAQPGDRSDPPHALAHRVASAVVGAWPAWAAPMTGPGAARVTAVGAISQPGATGEPERGHVVVLGGTDEDWTAVAAACPGTSWTVLGGAGGDLRPDRPGLRHLGRVPGGDVADHLARAEVVVAHAGQNAVAAVAAARRPAVLLAQERPFGEQAATVRLLDEAGLAVGLLDRPAAGEWPALLQRACAIGGAGWGRWADGRGAQRFADLLEGFR